MHASITFCSVKKMSFSFDHCKASKLSCTAEINSSMFRGAAFHTCLIAALFTSNWLVISLIAPLLRALFVECSNKACTIAARCPLLNYFLLSFRWPSHSVSTSFMLFILSNQSFKNSTWKWVVLIWPQLWQNWGKKQAKNRSQNSFSLAKRLFKVF